MRRNNIEFRQSMSRDEIVAWDGETCYTLAWLKEDKEGYYIETVGDRFTEHEDTEDVMLVAKYALRSLQNTFDFHHRQ